LSFEELAARHEDISAAHAKTCEWIFDRQDIGYTEWLSHGRDIFWISGKPGSGKSTLMKFLLSKRNRVRQYFYPTGSAQVVVASFFFWSTGTAMQRSLIGLFRSLLFQILSQAPQLVPLVFHNDIQHHWRNHNSIPEEWPIDRLYRTFTILSTQQDVELRILLLIDGLDEFEGNHTDRVRLLSLLIEVSTPEETQKARFAVCAASREENIFHDMLKDYPRLRMQDLTFSDIQTYVNDTLAQYPRMMEFRKFNGTEVESFERAIIDKASGVFLWVTMAVKSLLQGLSDRDTISELRARLEELPPELHDLYMNMLGKIDERHKDQARLIFGLVLLSTEPPSPWTISLAEDGPDTAIMIPVSDYNAEDVSGRSREMEGRIRSRCAGMLELNVHTTATFNSWSETQPLVSEACTVSVIHKSVRDFFKSPSGRGFLSPAHNTRGSDPAIALFCS
jgi:hypothetical protein